MTKEKKKKFKIRYIVIIMVIIAIAGGTFVAKQYFSIESKTTKLTFENIGKLSTQEVRCTTVKSESKDRKLFGQSIPFTKSEIIYSYDTDIQAGYDFTKIRYTVKDGAKNEKGKICVHLPEVEIISCDIDKDSFKLYHEDDNIFSPISMEEHNDALKELTDQAQEDAISNGLYDKAEENGKNIIKQFLYQGYDKEKYDIEFENDK